MKTLFLIFSILVYGTLSQAEVLDVASIKCQISNLMGVPTGQITGSAGRIEVQVGMLHNSLRIYSVEGRTISTMTNGQMWNYLFQFSSYLSLNQRQYSGVIYQQYGLGMPMPAFPIGRLSCDVQFKKVR